jgi:flavin reductase (DIM6/NTAB) family NADH-FMN oxidoreductase RutF
VRRFLEPGPVVLVSSAHRGERGIMTMGWHTVLEFSPSLVGCVISPANQSHGLILKSRECVINVPAASLVKEVVGIGNCSGREGDKFEKFGLTPRPARKVAAPLIAECFANFECRVVDAGFVKKYGFFVMEVVKAQVSQTNAAPPTLHYRGNGEFIVSGKKLNERRLFKPSLLD